MFTSSTSMNIAQNIKALAGDSSPLSRGRLGGGCLNNSSNPPLTPHFIRGENGRHHSPLTPFFITGENRRRLVIFLFLIVLATACGGNAIQPVEIADGDMCEFCRMAVSEQRYAAEFIDKDGDAHKFDEIGCMKAYVKKHSIRDAIYFVKDYQSRKWLQSGEAFFVHSTEFQTPMGGGIVAFSDQSAAAEAAGKYRGTTVPLW